jgi:hypothetical protein
MQLKTVITISVLVAIGTVTIALGRGPISETKFHDMSFVFGGDN